MAGGWLGRFALGTRLVYGAMQLGVTLGRTIAQVAGAIARAGARVEAGAIREIMERERAARRAAEGIAGGPRGRLPDPSDFAEAITRQRRTYSWRVRIGWIDPSTGKRRERYISISTDELRTPEEILEEAEELAARDYSIERSLIFESEIASATRAGPTQRL